PHPTQAIILCLTPSRCDPPIPAHWTHHSLDTNLKAPLLRTQRQLVQFCPRLAPCRIVDANQGEEPPAMSGLDQVKHLMHHHVLEQVLRLLHEFCVEADVARPAVAATPLGFHALEEVAGHLHPELWLPPADQSGYCIVQEGLVPFMDYRRTLSPAATGAHVER